MRSLATAYLPGVRRLPGAAGRVRDDVVLFESWRGKYADNPRAISEEIGRQRLPVRRVWVTDGSSPLPDDVETVGLDDWGYVRELRRAGWFVNNGTSLPGWYRKRPGARYLQTWHGTPLKRIAHDIEAPSFADWDSYVALLDQETRAWDRLLSPNRFSTEIFRRAFRYEGEIAETGYPRNDLLAGERAGPVREAVRTRLGIAPEETVVLYAPTWRDGQGFELALDARRVVDALGDSVRLLLRTHVMFADKVRLDDGPQVMDVSRHPEIAELYLAADVLVTDYSSVLFDFAVTGKPQLFFTYDLADYRDTLRGFYFDFEAEAPGPLLSTTDDVIAALGDLPAVERACAQRYAAFRERFCHLDDGQASARVVAQMFGT